MTELYARAARRGWWIPLVVLAISLATAALFTSRQTPVYRASATSVVAPAAELGEPSEIMRGLETLDRRTVVATFAAIAEARETRGAAAARLGLKPKELSDYRIDASVVPSTNIIRIAVEGPDGEGVRRIANAVARVTEAEAQAMYRIFSMRPLQAAVTAGAPIHPDPVRNHLVAGILGLFLGVVVAIGLEYLWPSAARPVRTAAPQRTHAGAVD